MHTESPTLDDKTADDVPEVLRIQDINDQVLVEMFATYGLQVSTVPEAQAIPGSHWGDDEAGLIKNTLYVRRDTPVHSALHEGCHWLLMDQARRAQLHTDAGGTQVEENAVCYLQIVLSDRIPEMGRSRMLADMDAWGYSFRLGSAQRWFEEDAEDAVAWLREQRAAFLAQHSDLI